MTTLLSSSPRFLLGCALALLAAGCASASANQTPAQNPTPAPRTMPWERAVDGGFENKGIATIDQMGSRWVLTVRCAGTHVTYLDETPVDLKNYNGAYVRARYHWVDRTLVDPRCVVPPCRDIKQRLIVIDTLEKQAVTPEQVKEQAATCS